MKSFFVLLLFVFCTSISYSQSPLQSGERQANFGVGLDNTGSVPLYVGVDFNIADNVTLGPIASISGDFFSGVGALNYHFDELFALPSEWNVYAGANVGFIASLDDNFRGDGFGIGLQLGGRYFFNEKWGANIEAGGGNQISGGKVGATFKF